MCERQCYLVKCTCMTEDVWVSFLLHSPLCLWSVCARKRGLLIEWKTELHGRGKAEGIASWMVFGGFFMLHMNILTSRTFSLFPSQNNRLLWENNVWDWPRCFPLEEKGATLIRWSCTSYFIEFYCCNGGCKDFMLKSTKLEFRILDLTVFPFLAPLLSALTGEDVLPWFCARSATLVGVSLLALSHWQPAMPCFGKSPYDKWHSRFCVLREKVLCLYWLDRRLQSFINKIEMSVWGSRWTNLSSSLWLSLFPIHTSAHLNI